MKEQLYGQHVCLNARVAVKPNGEFKEVGLAYMGNTVCNNAWIDVVPSGKMTPVCKTECQDCKKAGKKYRSVFTPRKPRTLSAEHLAKMQTAKQTKLAL